MRLVLVEDEALIAMLMEDALVMLGHEVIGVADDMAGTMALVERQRPDLALCDVKLLRGESGIDVADRLSGMGIPCLLVSGNCPRAGERCGAALGCLLKPFSVEMLDHAVSAAAAIAAGSAPAHLPKGMQLYGAASP